MKIDKNILIDILVVLREYYPHPLMSDGYMLLDAKLGEDTLDGHLVYLSEKGLINLSAEYVYKDAEGYEIGSPQRGEGVWNINASHTFINCNGLDYLEREYF